MSAGHLPYIKWYPTDWRADPRLRMCSLAARGLWIELIGYMHEGEPYGFLTINGEAPTGQDIAALVGRPLSEVRKAMKELSAKQVFSMSDDKIFSRRMVRDKAKAEKDHTNGKGGGNPKLRGEDKEGVNPPDKAQKPEASPEAKKDSEANASGAEAPDHRKRLFDVGLSKLAAMTGKGPDACRSFVGKCLKAASDDAITVLGLIEEAERNRVVDPSAWIAARLKTPMVTNGKPQSPIIQAADNLIRTIAGFDGPAREVDELRGTAGEASPRLLSHG